MPRFYTDAEISVDVSEFVYACDGSELNEIIEILKEDGLITSKNPPTSLNEEFFSEEIKVISENYINLTKEEENIISNIAKRFRYH